jgi:hypothetical protein
MTVTLATMRADVRAHLDEASATFWTDAQLNSFINDALRDIARRTETLQTIGTIAVTAGTRNYTLNFSPNLVRVHRVEFDPGPGSGPIYPLEARNFYELDQVWGSQQNQTRAYPDYWCVDEATEILTTRGFKSHRELIVGEDVYVLRAPGVGAWEPLRGVIVYEQGPETLISMEGKEHSSRTTPDHRWFVESRVGTGTKHRVPKWRTTETLQAEDAIPVAAPCVNLPTNPKYTDEFVELVAWAWTEGSYRRGVYEAISQSLTANAGYVDRIRRCLLALYGPPPSQRRRGGVYWRETRPREDMVSFTLSRELSDQLNEVAPARVVRPDFIAALTRAQLNLFIETSVDADGTHRTKGGPTVFQSDRVRLDPLQMAATLAGFASRIRPTDGVLAFYRKQHIHPILAAKAPRAFQIGVVPNAGSVWCPRTPSGTWLARRAGATFFTGNCLFGFPPTLSIYLFPVPSQVGNLNVFYYRLPATAAADGDVLEIVEGYWDLVTLFAEVQALRKDADPRFADARQLYEAKIGEMIDMTRHYHDQQGYVTSGRTWLPGWLTSYEGDW